VERRCAGIARRRQKGTQIQKNKAGFIFKKMVVFYCVFKDIGTDAYEKPERSSEIIIIITLTSFVVTIKYSATS
jgi:hypothetical protein